MIGFSRLGYEGFLGNQMFQYALLQGVAAKNNYEVCIPKRYKFIPEQTAWNQMGWVQLKPFNITALPEKGHKFKNKFKEESFAFDERVFEVEDDTDFSGYFQSYKYFEHIADKIRSEFTFGEEIRKKTQDFLDKLPRPLVSVHVRRGTYLKPPHTETHRVLDMNYYNTAMEMFPGCHFLVFSDGMDWCKKHFKNVFYSEFKQWLDLSVMSKCDHHIISASSFSWWGAWLNPAGKRVVAPKIWFGPKFSHFDTSELCPKDWVKI